MLKTLCLGFVVLVAGCASLKMPPFQPIGKGDVGYRIDKSEYKWVFKVHTALPSSADAKYSVLYGYRAVGEECLTRGYRYFDVGVESPNDFDGYCYSSGDHDGLGVEFTQVGLDKRPQHFVVADLNGKTKTQLQKKDELLEISGQPMKSVAQVKAAVVKAVLANEHLIDLKVARDDQVLTVKEPIAVFKDSSMGSDVLDLARSRTN